MANFVKVASIDEIPQGRIKTVFVQGKAITLANVDGAFFAVDDSCTHEECSLGSEGFLDGNLITCGCHGSVFEATTGRVRSLPAAVDLATYPTKVEGNDILVQIKS